MVQTLIGAAYLTVLIVYSLSAIPGAIFAITTVFVYLNESISKLSFKSNVNFDYLKGTCIYLLSTEARALFLIHSFKAINDLLISFVSLNRALSWNWESEAFSDPTRSIIYKYPSSAAGTRVFSTLT